MISVDDARTLVLKHAKTLSSEQVALGNAIGRILRAPITADRDFPPFDRAAMDGFAVRSSDAGVAGARLRVAGEIRAGQMPVLAVASGEAIRIMTGAPVPAGADAVVQVEKTRIESEGSRESVLLDISIAAGQNVVSRGSESKAGAALLDEGVRIGTSHLAILASVGCATPMVSKRPRVAILITGDEVVPPSADPLPVSYTHLTLPTILRV